MSDTLLGGGAGDYAKVPEHHGGVVVAEALAAAGELPPKARKKS